jgi:hypothetical protein
MLATRASMTTEGVIPGVRARTAAVTPIAMVFPLRAC